VYRAARDPNVTLGRLYFERLRGLIEPAEPAKPAGAASARHQQRRQYDVHGRNELDLHSDGDRVADADV
jgi:hypothetical protein